jgi:16S rRNA (cytosine967-C5)-methyltransferase
LRFSAPILQSRRGYRGWRRWPTEDNPYLVRSLSLRIIRSVEEDALLDETIDRLFSRASVSPAYKSLIYEMTAGVIRWKGYLDSLLSAYARKPVQKDVRYLLWLALYQSFFMKKGAHHVVNETVEFVKKEKGVAVAHFVNAVLRKALAEKEGLSDKTSEARLAALRSSFPRWLVRRWSRRFGSEETDRLLDTLNTPPRFGLRIDQGRIALPDVMEHLQKKGLAVARGALLSSALTVDKLYPVLSDDLFRRGLIRVQDEASQLAAHAVSPQSNQRVLDACAGMGTKTEHLLQLCNDARVVAMDIRLERAPALSGARMVKGDILNMPFKRSVFDTILLDAPCSSLGILRKHPEIKWRRTEEHLARFGAYQLNLLRNVWESVVPGGACVYSVCSFEPEETVNVLRDFAADKQFLLENPLPFLFNKEYFLSVPHQTGTDGFFIAKLRKV